MVAKAKKAPASVAATAAVAEVKVADIAAPLSGAAVDAAAAPAAEQKEKKPRPPPKNPLHRTKNIEAIATGKIEFFAIEFYRPIEINNFYIYYQFHVITLTQSYCVLGVWDDVGTRL